MSPAGHLQVQGGRFPLLAGEGAAPVTSPQSLTPVRPEQGFAPRPCLEHSLRWDPAPLLALQASCPQRSCSLWTACPPCLDCPDARGPLQAHPGPGRALHRPGLADRGSDRCYPTPVPDLSPDRGPAHEGRQAASFAR